VGIINGTTFLLYKDDVAIGHTSETAVSLNVDLPTSTSKDSAGFQEVLAGVRSGSVSASGLVNYDDAVNFEELADMVLTRQRAEFFFTQATGGEGFLTSVEQVADSEVATTFDIEISITGLFSIIDETDGEVWNAAQDIWNQIDINWNEI
jgi:predicted secreted protein